jgi:Icc-related predicted phosphoesterase
MDFCRYNALIKTGDNFMRILALADIHGHTKNIPALAKAADACDVIVLAGDITDFGSREQAQAVLAALNKFGKPVLSVPGNCDPPEVEEVLRQQGGDIIQTPVKIGAVLFVGLPYGISEKDTAKYADRISESDAEKVVLVSHEPAWGTAVDMQAATRHKGSQAVWSFIERVQPACAVSGHIHEARGTDRLGSTLLVNPGPFRNDCYVIIDIEADSVQAKLLV